LKIKNINPILAFFTVSIFLEAMDAFSAFSIPVPWVGIALIISLYIFNYFFGYDFEFDEIPSLRIWLFYIFSITTIRALSFDSILPEYATTTFSQYISLRLFKLLGFVTTIWAIHLISQYTNKEKIIEYVVYVGVIVSLFSLYSYFSYFLELPDFTRSRPGSGGWTQPIKRACSVLRNYGTFREPSFLAVWLAPIVPLIFHLAKKNNYWYLASVLPLLSLVLTRSLTGVVTVISAFLLTSFIWAVINKSINFQLLIPVVMILIFSILGNSMSYKFPALDPSMCPPESPDKCNCSIYDDKLDEAKNSESITKSIFTRLTLISSGGIDAFENISFLKNYILSENIKILGDGLGTSNINYSYQFEELSKQEKDGKVVYRNPGQIVSFNNLYANIYLSAGLIGLFWFLIIIINLFRKLLNSFNDLNLYLFINMFIVLMMYFFQAEELGFSLAISIGLITLNDKNE